MPIRIRIENPQIFPSWESPYDSAKRENALIDVTPPVRMEPIGANGRRLSGEVIRIIETAITEAAGTASFEAALEVGYRAFGLSACTAAAHEGVQAFQQRRTPDFTKTG